MIDFAFIDCKAGMHPECAEKAPHNCVPIVTTPTKKSKHVSLYILLPALLGANLPYSSLVTNSISNLMNIALAICFIP